MSSLAARAGHRRFFHSLLFAFAVGVGGTALGAAGRWWTAVPLYLALALAFGAVWHRHGLRNEIAAAAVTGLVMYTSTPVPWLGVALALGCVAHDLGDKLTDRPVMLCWPSRFLSRPLGLFTTDTPAERRFARTVLVGNAALAVTVGGWWPQVVGFAETIPVFARVVVGA